jgi:ribosomal protein L29
MKEIKDLKLMQKNKIVELDQKALKAELVKASRNLFQLEMKKELNELKQTHLIKALRRYIAVIKTIANTKGFNIA